MSLYAAIKRSLPARGNEHWSQTKQQRALGDRRRMLGDTSRVLPELHRRGTAS
ncbi:MAG TPA: hypothetical protein VGI26_05595 [Solirubrobacteraceae bacterium]